MPKGNELYPDRLDFFVSHDMRLKVIGLSFLMGAKGEHATAARKMLELGMKTYMDGLSKKKKEELEFIMSRVRIAEDPKGWGEGAA
jgi:hypothetical protein